MANKLQVARWLELCLWLLHPFLTVPRSRQARWSQLVLGQAIIMRTIAVHMELREDPHQVIGPGPCSSGWSG
jgi:hypothetical protein